MCCYDIVCLQAKEAPLKIALGEIFLPKINRWVLESECPGWKVFEKLISGGGGGASIGHSRVQVLESYEN